MNSRLSELGFLTNGHKPRGAEAPFGAKVVICLADTVTNLSAFIILGCPIPFKPVEAFL